MKKIMILFVIGALAVLGQATARADFQSFTPPESSITQDEKLFLTAADNPGATTFQGVVGDQFVGPIVDMVADATTKVVANGWATISNVNNGGTFTSLTFTPRDSNLFTDFTLRGQLATAGDVTITVTDNNSQTFTFTNIPKNEDFSRIGVEAISGTGETISQVVVSTSVSGGFNELKQIAFSTTTTPPAVVPEPSSMAIAGLGALGLIGYGLRRRRGA